MKNKKNIGIWIGVIILLLSIIGYLGYNLYIKKDLTTNSSNTNNFLNNNTQNETNNNYLNEKKLY